MHARRALAALLAAAAVGSALAASADAVVYGRAVPTDAVAGLGQLLQGDEFSCGATLIAPQIVLTAAHCVAEGEEGPVRFEVAFGRADAEGHDGQEIDVTDVVLHPKYLSRSNPGLGYDVALLRLAQPPSGVAVAQLAGPRDAAALSAGAPVRIAGWGLTERTRGDGDRGSDTLREATLRVRSRRGCKRAIAARRRALQAPLKVVECLGADVRPYPAPCYGDSGGPLLVDTPGGTRLAGVTSYLARSGACGNGTAVYARTWTGPLHQWVTGQLAAGTLAGDPPRQ